MDSMKIHQLKIKGFKSIGEITLDSPKPFSVFVGANGAGKSNIFEALEFFNFCDTMDPREAAKDFGGTRDLLNQIVFPNSIEYEIDLGEIKPQLILTPVIEPMSMHFDYKYDNYGTFYHKIFKPTDPALNDTHRNEYKHLTNFTRLFVGKNTLVKRNIQDDSQIAFDASNLEKILKRIFQNERVKDEITEILQLLVPGFNSIEIKSEELSGTDSLLVYEKSLQKPLTKRLISDGTYNILAILAAIYQSDRPQFLCIEEPENGLNPKVVKELVNIIRNQCEEKGHYIWLNTHSQTLVSELLPEEIILVDKVNGMTQTKQVIGMNLHGLKMDEALLTNSLGGGIPW